jgi:hypothetical protein
MLKKTALTFLVLAFVLACSSAAIAQTTGVMRVLVVKTDNVTTYVQELQKGQEILKGIGSPAQIHVWQARFAGEDAGTIMVEVSYPSMTALAADDARIAASADYQTWLKGLGKLRKIESDSLYRGL